MTRLFVNTNVGVLIDTFILHADLTTFQKYFSKEISNTLTIRKKIHKTIHITLSANQTSTEA